MADADPDDDTQTGVVVVALPAADDPVQDIGPEQKHATVLYFGDVEGGDNPNDQLTADFAATLRSVLEVAASTYGPLTEAVTSVDSLGDEGALVWMLKGTDLPDLRDDLLDTDSELVGPLEAVAQHPSYTPHVTIGYLSADPEDETTEAVWRKAAAGVEGITFDRLALWWAGVQTEFPLTADSSGVATESNSRDGGPMPESLLLQETAVLTEAAASAAKKSGRMVVQLISPGQGSSGYYSPAVLEQAAKDLVIPAGTRMFADHPTEAEARERPVRSIKDLVSITTEAARVATRADVAAGADQGALVAEVKVIGPYREVIEDLAGAIGPSIRGDATDITFDDSGRKIIEGLAHVASVDWVTRPGRGGRTLHVLEVLESARAQVEEAKYDAEQMKALLAKGHAMANADGDPSYPIADTADLKKAIAAVGRGGGDHDAIRAHIIKRAKALKAGDMIPENWTSTGTKESAQETAEVVNARAVAHGVSEATVNDVRDRLSALVGEAYGTEKTYVYVCDFDDTTVWFRVSSNGGDGGTFGQAYTSDSEGALALTGSRAEVRSVTTYVPTKSGGTATKESLAMTEQQTEAPPAAAPAEAATVQTQAPPDTGTPPAAAAPGAPAAESTPTPSPTKENTMTDNPTGAGATAAPAAQEAATAAAPTHPRQVYEARLNEQGRQIQLIRAGQQAQSVVAGVLAEGWVADPIKLRLARELTAEAVLPLTEAGELDEAELQVRAVAALHEAEIEAAETMSAFGFGKVRGLGVTESATQFGSAAARGANPYGDRMTDAFKALGLSEAAVETAAKGR